VSQLWGGLVSDDTSMPQEFAAMNDCFLLGDWMMA
jgi:hypothetical protein